MTLRNIIAEKIKTNGAIGFDEFMDLALYHPNFGYYRSNSIKIGNQGDFITAPETSDLFGFTLAQQINQIGGDILEFGAGNGVMAAQILVQLKKQNQLPRRYYILELSQHLKRQQKKNIGTVLPEIKDTVVWLDALPNNFNGTIIANEVLDAMPAKRIIYTDGFYELGVNFDADFKWQKLKKFDKNIQGNFINGYITEYNQQNLAWIKSIYKIINKGVLLIIDYGFNAKEFYHPDRGCGTLRCYKNHQADDNPFIDIGYKDITTWVNFSSVAITANNSGFEILGYATQAMFLISLGIEKFLINEKNEKTKINLANQIKQLVFPNAMGENFKILALGKNTNKKLLGFKEQNLMDKL